MPASWMSVPHQSALSHLDGGAAGFVCFVLAVASVLFMIQTVSDYGASEVAGTVLGQSPHRDRRGWLSLLCSHGPDAASPKGAATPPRQTGGQVRGQMGWSVIRTSPNRV
jgi:hypothetical protein